MLLLVGLYWLVVAMASSAEEHCTSNVPVKEWFPPYNSSRPLTDWGHNPLGWGACQSYSRATCCEKNHTDVVTRVTLLMNNAKFASNCQKMTEDVLCALACDPDVGLGHRQAVVCPGTCRRWFSACQDEFVTPPANSVYRLPITPCLDSSLVCSKIQDMFSSGAQEFCQAMSVVEASSSDECLSLQAESNRRGKPVAKPVFTPQRKGAFEQFVDDFRPLIRSASNWYMTNVDRLVQRHYKLLAWFGVVSLVFVSLPLFARFWMRNRRIPNAEEDENDDFTR
ncbi:hypothetical protein BASA81_004870 [Batrachochytrium salamandrivorans]|nr:hypothetical protein BASA81_004870 [Batrachochytrium salamandrivorans]